MLIVRTCVMPSKIHGLGLFASEPILKGQVIACWSHPFDQSIPPHVVHGLPEPIRSTILKHAYLEAGEWHLNGDDLRFANHSDHPNMGCILGWDYALQSIRCDEELTINYRTFDEDWHRKLTGVTA